MTDFKQYNLPSKEEQDTTLGFTETPNVLGQKREIVFDKSTSIGPGFCGTYTPELIHIQNILTAETHPAQYMRIGEMCLVSGIFRIDPVAGGGGTDTTNLYFTLPFVTHFDSTIDSELQCAGSATSAYGIATPALITGVVYNNKSYAQISFNANDTTNRHFSWILMYRII